MTHSATPGKKILVIGPAWVGDMVMAQTLFILLKSNDHSVIIDVLATDATRPILSRMPEVRQALHLPFSHGELNLRARFALGRHLRAQGYDQSIVLKNSFKSVLVPFFAGIPLRTGWLGEQRWGLLNDVRRLDKEKWPLMIQRFMQLGLPKGGSLAKELPFPALQTDAGSVQAALTQQHLTQPDRPLLVLCPGAEYGPAKRWSPVYFAEIAKKKAAEGWLIWIMGGKGDRPFGYEIQTLSGKVCVDLTGHTSLVDAVDLMSLATVVVSNDSGLMHVAAALGRPLVAIYGASSSAFTPPLGKQIRMLSLDLACSPCFKRTCPLQHYRCMTELHPKKALEAIEALEVS